MDIYYVEGYLNINCSVITLQKVLTKEKNEVLIFSRNFV